MLVRRRWPLSKRKIRLVTGLVIGVASVVLTVGAVVAATQTPNSSESSRRLLAQIDEENAELINVLGFEIDRNRVQIPSDWGESLTKEMSIQAAYDGEDIWFRAQFPSRQPGVLHDLLVYEGGEWVTHGKSDVGSVEDGLYEDRFTFHVDDGSVRGFVTQGCSVACHSDLRDPFTYAAPSKAEVGENSYFANVINKTDTRHYIPDSRVAGEDWWDVSWDAISESDAPKIAGLKDQGVFLDQWHWRASRVGPAGVSDDMWVLDYRNGDGGASAYSTNFDSETNLPKEMFDPEVAGHAALRWEDVKAWNIDLDGAYYLAPDTMKEFDPDYPWKEGDVLPRRYLRSPEGSRADITSRSSWDDGMWTVELRRAMDTGNADDKAFFANRVYNIAFAFYTSATGNRFHYVTFPKTLSLTQLADINGTFFVGDEPDWGNVPTSTFTAFYPGQSSWQYITSDEHPGAPGVRANTRSCSSCHEEEQLSKLSVGLELRGERESGRALTWIAGLVGILGIAGSGMILRRA